MEPRQSAFMWIGTTLLNIYAFLDKGTISFIMGMIVSILAITNYFLSIKERRANLKRLKQQDHV